MESHPTRAGRSGPTRRHRVLRVALVSLVGLFVATASLLSWQLLSARAAHGGSGAPPGPSRGSGGSALAAGTTPGTPTPATAAPTTSAPITSAPITSAPITSAPTTSAPATGPLRVLEIGDSLGVDLGDAMLRDWSTQSAQVTMAARTDTGLTNRAFYDWPGVLTGLLASARPQVVVVLLGANDLQPMATGSTDLADGTPAWDAAYAARVEAVISECVDAGSRVLWVGEPAMQDAFLTAGMTRLDGIAQQVVDHFPGNAAYLSANSVLAPSGTFTSDVLGPTGQEQVVRTPDGVHLMPAGSDLLAGAVATALTNAWGMQVVDQHV